VTVSEVGRRGSTFRDQPGTEASLWTTYKRDGSPDIREQLFDHYLPLARRIAARFYRGGTVGAIEFEELVQLSCAGLLEAIDRFNPELGVPFRYFGNRRMSGSILNGIARYSEVNQQISARKRMVSERIASLRPDESVSATTAESLNILGEIAAGLAVGFMLDESRAFASEACDPAHNGYHTLEWKQTIATLGGALEQLPPREQKIIRLHYLEGVPFEQLSAVFGITKGRVSQLHKAAVGLLRKRLLQTGDFSLCG
jgi:RNA polymerase sigma factor FliA